MHALEKPLFWCLDLSAAFDTVDHDVLLADLFSCGIREDAHSLLKSYLTNRFQRTSVGASLSEPVHLQFGVPQGSVLGPILFTLYTSSLATLLEAHNVAYHFLCRRYSDLYSDR